MNKDCVKEWLKAIGKNRGWLAYVMDVNKRTVDNWLSSSQPISRQGAALIRNLMSQYPAVITNDGSQSKGVAFHDTLTPQDENSLTLTVDSETFDLWDQASRAEGKLLREWATDVLTEQANTHL